MSFATPTSVVSEKTDFYDGFAALEGQSFDRNRDFRNFFEDSDNKKDLLQIAKRALHEGKGRRLLDHVAPQRQPSKRSPQTPSSSTPLKSDDTYALPTPIGGRISETPPSSTSGTVGSCTQLLHSYVTDTPLQHQPQPSATSLDTSTTAGYTNTLEVASSEDDTVWLLPEFTGKRRRSYHAVSTDEANAYVPLPFQQPTYEVLNLFVKEETEDASGAKRKRITLPENAFVEREAVGVEGGAVQRVVKFIQKYPLPYNGNLPIFLEALEAEIENFLNKCVLHGTSIFGPENIYKYLLAFKPVDMEEEEYTLWCEKPMGMSANAYLDILSQKDEALIEASIQQFMQTQVDNIGFYGNLEGKLNQTIKEFKRQSRRMNREIELWEAIQKKMQTNIASKVLRLTHTSKHEGRLTAGYASLQWGRILNMLDWKKGDEIVRERGFALDLQQIRNASLSQQIHEVFGLDHPVDSAPSVHPGQDLYFKKALSDAKTERLKAKSTQRDVDRLQAIVEFSSKPPDTSLMPPNLLLWKCMGISYSCVLWKVFDISNALLYVTKYRDISSLNEEERNLLKRSYAEAEVELRSRRMPLALAQSILFSAGGIQFRGNHIVEAVPYLSYLTLDEYIYKFGLMKKEEELLKAKWIVFLLLILITSLDGLNFILPIKLSRICLKQKDIIFRVGFPESLLSVEAKGVLRGKLPSTIASELWAENALDYLPPECKGMFHIASRDEKRISKVHTWMIGMLLYRMTCESAKQEKKGVVNLDLCEDLELKNCIKSCLNEDLEQRPLVTELLDDALFKRLKETPKLPFLKEDDMEVNKIQFAMEAFPDMEAIVNETLCGDDRGVDVYDTEPPLRQATDTESDDTDSWTSDGADC